MTTHTEHEALLFYIATSKALILHQQDIAWPEPVESIGPPSPIGTAQLPTALGAPHLWVFPSLISQMRHFRLTEGQDQPQNPQEEEALRVSLRHRSPCSLYYMAGRLCLCNDTIISALSSAMGV